MPSQIPQKKLTSAQRDRVRFALSVEGSAFDASSLAVTLAIADNADDWPVQAIAYADAVLAYRDRLRRSFITARRQAALSTRPS